MNEWKNRKTGRCSRIAAGILAALSLSYAASAASYEYAAQYTYDQIKMDAFDGNWVTVFDVFDLYLPRDWNVSINEDLGSQAVTDHLYYLAVNEEKTMSFAISYMDASDLGMSLTDLYDSLTEMGYENVNYVLINGIPMLSYEFTNASVCASGLCTLGDLGGFYNISFTFLTEQEEEAAVYVANILPSFRQTE